MQRRLACLQRDDHEHAGDAGEGGAYAQLGRHQRQHYAQLHGRHGDEDPLFLDFIDSIKIKRSARNKKINKRNRQLLKEGEELLKDFSLNPDEIENIFDILEENNIDI